MSSSLNSQDNLKKTRYINGIELLAISLSQGFEKLLDEANKNENSQLPRKLDPKAITELIKLFTELIFLLSSSCSLSIFDVNLKLHKGELGAFSWLVPQEKHLKEIESVVVNRNAKKRKQYFHGPFEKVHNLLKEINQNMKPLVAYYIYGVAEKMIYLILEDSVFYEESTQLKERFISQTTIQNVVKLKELRKTADTTSARPNHIPPNYDKCADQLRYFLQSSYDQCNIILRVYFDPVKAKLPDSIKQVHRLVSSFINIFRAMLESIEDMNDHVSSGGSGRNIEQGLIGYCLEGPAEDYLLYDFTTYTTLVNNGKCKSELLSVVDDEEAVKSLINRGRSIMQTILSKYDSNRGFSWPWLHKGCVNCSVLTTGSKVNEAFVVNEQIPGSSQMADAADVPISDSKCNTKCNYLLNCYIYLLPRLLFVPIFHFLYLQELIEQLSKLSYNEEDQISLKEVVSFFHGTRKDIIDILKNVPNLETIYNRLTLLHIKEYQPMCNELKFSLKHISTKLEEINNICGTRPQELNHYNNSEFIMNGNLMVQIDNKRFVRRTVYLFNNVLLIYKLQESGWKPPSTQNNSQFKLKKIIPLDCIHIIDGDNINEHVGQSFDVHVENFGSTNFFGDDSYVCVDNKSKTNTYFGFRLQYQDQKPSNGSLTIQTMNFATNVLEEKCDWIACLLQIQTSKLFEKYIKELPKQEIPLRLPHPKKYKFSEPDSNENIRFEKTENDGFLEISDEEDNNEDMSSTEMNYHCNIKKPFAYGHPQIRYATLHKLIERLTYHTYHDLRALHMFLLAYRRFTTPVNLFDLLIERFTIPEPDFTMEERTPEWKDEKSQADQMLKRFKNSYQRRVQRRVIWVLLRWVQNPGFFRYDFAHNPEQREKLVIFVNSIKTKELQKACQILKQKCCNEDSVYSNVGDTQLIYEKDCPPILSWDLVRNANDIRITNVHPVELARQITLHEWDLYHRIEYWEVEGKESTSENTPNLSKSKDFSNKLRNWLVYSILSEEHPEDRAVALMRVADIMLLCEHWNNLQGSQEARAALISASVFRLKKSFNLIIRKYKTYKQVFNDLRKEHENGKGHKPSLYTQEYENNIQKIEEADPPVPCVPFIAFGVTTKLIHTELKSPDTINTESGNVLINFRKHRRLSQIIERYLSFQRLPYQFLKDPMISTYLTNLDPLKSTAAKNDDDFERIMFEISERYEPRDVDSHNIFEAALVKERRLSKPEQKYADEIANLSTKEKKELSTRHVLIHNSSLTMTSTNRSISGLSSSTLSSEPSTPTNAHVPSSFSESSNIDKSPTFGFPPHRMSDGVSDLSIESHFENPPLPPRSKDMTRNEFNFNSPTNLDNSSAVFSQSFISPRLPPRLSRAAVPPPLPTRHSKD